VNCPECHKHRDYNLCKVCNLCTNCCDCVSPPLEPIKFVRIQPKHLKSLRSHLSKYLYLLCDQAKEGENVKEIYELAMLWLAIDTSLETDCNDTV